MIIIAKDVVEYNDLKVGDWVEYEVKRVSSPIKTKTNERRSN